MKTIQLTQQQIDRLYFSLKDYVKTSADVDRLNDLTPSQKEIYKNELEIILQMSFYMLGMKGTTRITFARNAHWNHIDTTNVYYAHTKLQA